MATIKKYNGSSWENAVVRKYGTASEIITPPTTIYTDGTAISTYSIKGNTVQNGTPTPSAPISVQGVGELETTGEHSGEYKIPISSGGVTTNIYLGSTQTVRAVKKIVLTGDESFSYDSTNKYYSRTGYGNGVNYLGVCTHYVFRSTNTEGDAYIAPWGAMRIYDSSYSGNVTQFKTWIAAQYANGTPVTFYYALATAETGTVNEPIRKIGDYADTVSGITIPTVTGKDTFDVLTTLKPSEVELTYTGWHDATVKEWDGSQWD